MRRRNIGTIAAAVLIAVAFIVGCDSDGYDEAGAVSAGQIERGAGGQQADRDRGGRESAGPIDGRDRPPDHPTLRGGADEGQVEAPRVDRPAYDEYGEAGPIRWEAPDSWRPVPPQNEMRYAEYRVADEEGAEEAELTVFFFGAGAGGDIESNLQRWADQFSDGPVPERSERRVDDMTIYTLEAAGTYETDMAMGAADGPKEDYRLLGAIAETEEGNFFFRLLGPDEVVRGQSSRFEAFVESLHTGS